MAASIQKLSNAQLIKQSGIPLSQIDMSKLSDDDLYELAGMKPPGLLEKAGRIASKMLVPGENQDITTGSPDAGTEPVVPVDIVGGAPASEEESRYLMGAPTKPKIRGAQRYFGETQIRKPTESEAQMYADDPTLIQQFVQKMPGIAESIGMSPEQIAERKGKFESAKAAVELNGGRVQPQVYDQFVKGVVNEALLGLPQAIEKSRGEEFISDPTTTREQIARGAGSLTGFIVGAPGKVTKMVLSKTHDLFPALKLTGEENLLQQMGKMATSEAAGLGVGTGAASTGEALSQKDVSSALKVVIESMEGGALTGATFGATKGAIPGNAPVDKILRIASGVAALDVMRGKTPVDERELNQKVFDYGMDVYFLWKGIPRSKLNGFEKEIVAGYEKAKTDFDAEFKTQDKAGAWQDAGKTQQEGAAGGAAASDVAKRPATSLQAKSVAKLPSLILDKREGGSIAALDNIVRDDKGEPVKMLAEDGSGKELVQVNAPQGIQWVDAATVEAKQPEAVTQPEATKALPAPEPKQITYTPDMKPDYSGASIGDKGKFPVFRVKTAEVKADPEKFQFKLDTNKEGEQVPLQGEWNDLAAGNFIVWQAKDGQLYVANGHHRLAHAKRTGQEEINAQVLREADGYTVRDARNLAAESNILEGKGTIFDHAEYFRTTDGYDDGMAAKRGIKGRGYAIGKDATDSTYWLFKGKDITPEQAEAVAKTAPKDEALQGVGAKYAMNNKKADPTEIASFMRAMAFEKSQSQGTGGQEDLFGYDDTAIRDAEAQAKEVAKIVRSLKEEKQAISLAKSDKKIDLASKHGIDINNKDAVRKRIEDIDREIESWDKWYINPELVKVVRERAGLAPKSAEPAQTEATAQAAETGQPSGEKVEIETDPARRQEIRNSIAEGEMILKSGRKSSGAKMSEGEIEAVRRSVEKAKARLGGETDTDRIFKGTKENEGSSEELDGLGAKDTFGLTSEGAGTAYRGKFEGKTQKKKPESGTLFDRGDAYADRPTDQKRSAEKTPEERAEYSGRKRKVIEIPELVEMAKNLLAGKIPSLKEIIGRDPAIRGAFFPRGNESRIELTRRLFSDPDTVAKVLAHEIGHAVDYLPDHNMAKGNILGRIKSVKNSVERMMEEYPDAPEGILTKADKARLKAEAEAEVRSEADKPARVIIEEIMKEVPVYAESGITPEMILGLLSGRTPGSMAPELMEYLKRADTKVKKNIAKQAIQGVVDEALKQFGERVQVGTELKIETVTREEGGRKFSQKWVNEEFAKKVAEEIQRRRLFEWETITKELKDLTHTWKPFDAAADSEYTKYRYKSEELYADAISVLMNEPDLLHEKAPTFTKAFFNFLENKPEFKRIYEETQDLMNQERDILLEKRDQAKRQMYETGEKQAFFNRMKSRLSPARIWTDIKKVLIDENTVAREILGRADVANPMDLFGSEMPSGKGKLAKYWLEEIPYMIAPVYEHTMKVEKTVADPLKKAGATIEDLGLYMELRREMTERSGMANPGGFIGEVPEEQMDYLRRKLGADKFRAVEQAANDFWKLRQDNVIPMLKESGMYSDKLMKKIEENENYATFETYLEGKYGQGNTKHIMGYIHMQRGTLGNIRNPFVATMLKDAALMRAAQIKTAKRAIVEALFGLDEAKPAKTSFNGKFHEIAEPDNSSQGLISFLENGKMKGYYVPKDIADTFYRRPLEGSNIINLWQAINQPLRAILVSHNPIWMAANLIRDGLGSAKNLPDATIPKLLKHYKNAFGEAWDDAIKGEQSDRINEMLKKRMLVTDRQLDAWDREYVEGQSEYDMVLQSFGKTPVTYRNKVLKPLSAVWDGLGRFGKFTERLGKLAGEGYLRDIQAEKGYSEEDIAHKVRSTVSTPDPFRRGAWNILTNNLFLFSNIGKEGFRASWEAANESPGNYIWKTIKYNIIPKVMFAGAMYGMMGDDLKKLTRSVSEYMRENYMVVPLMFNSAGKAVYLTIPQDYTGQVIGGLVGNMLEGKLTGKGGMFSYGAEQMPYSLNPLVDAAGDIWHYYAKGQNPYDDFRGREIMTEDVYKAGGARANQAMGKHLWNTLGGSAVYKFKEREEADKVEGEMEKFLRMPGGNVVGRFLRVGNYGETEHLKGEIVEPIEKELARKRLEVKDKIIESVNSLEGKEPSIKVIGDIYRELRKEGSMPDGTSVAEFRKRYMFYVDQAKDVPKVDAVMSAKSNEAKAALLSSYQKEMPEDEYKSLLKQLMREGHISISTMEKKFSVEKKASSK